MILTLVLLRWVLRREALERQAERDRRLASLGEMSAVLAHEMRNPLTSLKGHAQLLAESLPAESRDHAKAERVVTEAQRLERLTGDLLEFVRSGEIHRAPCNPEELVRESARAVDESRFDISAEDAPSSWSLDRERMQQVLTNLMRNALQSSPADARVDARVRAFDGVLSIAVRDRGEGIAEGDSERIFEPFHTQRTRGTGLGLAVARRIVELHGGTIRAANHPEGGAVFRISIPEE
jgi:two-component system sensor histidine kinase HydH